MIKTPPKKTYASLIIPVYIDSLKKYVEESLNSIAIGTATFKPHPQIESNWGLPITTQKPGPRFWLNM